MRLAWTALLLASLAGAQGSGDPDAMRKGCVRDAEVPACRQALRLVHDDAELASAAGDVLMQARRPAEAISAYRRALALGFAGQESLDARIAGAEAQRQAMLSICQSREDELARRACDAVLLPGSVDEPRVLARRARIQEGLSRPAEALEDYIAAQRFVPQDPQVAVAILHLTEVGRRDDNAALVARGTALLALGRPAEAVAPLRQALARDPASRPLQALLQSAQSREPAVTLESAQFPAPRERRFSNTGPASRSH
ncbi:MAG: hypothetical protein U1F35_10200 [Steroidobacteraceae bacterium]